MKYIIIAYKPESCLMSMGHEVDTYPGDFDIIKCDTEEEMIEKVAEIKSRNLFLDKQEYEYEITVIKGDILFTDGESIIVKDSSIFKLFNKIDLRSKIIAEKRNGGKLD